MKLPFVLESVQIVLKRIRVKRTEKKYHRKFTLSLHFEF